jgi:hypothetical protein
MYCDLAAASDKCQSADFDTGASAGSSRPPRNSSSGRPPVRTDRVSKFAESRVKLPYVRLFDAEV